MKTKILKSIKPYKKWFVLAGLRYYLTGVRSNAKGAKNRRGRKELFSVFFALSAVLCALCVAPTPAGPKDLCKAPINRILSLHKIL
jgi:hypothetical protein